ncbi:hypothetical protein ACTXT7_011834 [Hymenolepis weldensis]
MTRDVARALTKYAYKLRDDSVDNESKLQMLVKLDRISVELGLISDTGIGRAVKSLSSSPNEIGKLARNLVSKWRNLLKQHIGKSQTSESSVSPSVSNERQEIHGKECSIVPKSLDANKSEFRDPLQPPATKSLKRRPSSLPSPSLDSSSGLSFEAALSLSTPIKKKSKHPKLAATAAKLSDSKNGEKCSSQESHAQNPGQPFTEEILKSLADPFERPDVQPTPQRTSAPCTSFDNLDDDGDLKFRSKRVIWAPRINRQNGKAFESPTADLTHRTSPLKLLDLCILALSKNVSMIDHVGLVPYEIFAPVLKDASTEDLYRIQKCNPWFVNRDGNSKQLNLRSWIHDPSMYIQRLKLQHAWVSTDSQFRGLTDDLWKKHVLLNFPLETRSVKGPGEGETWFEVYKKIKAENKRRLDRFINRSTQKIKAEEERKHFPTLILDRERGLPSGLGFCLKVFGGLGTDLSRRRTLITDVITPRLRRGNGGGGSSGGGGLPRRIRRSASPPERKPFLTPINMSYPSPSSSSNGTRNGSISNRSGGGGTNGSGTLLKKLRKQSHIKLEALLYAFSKITISIPYDNTSISPPRSHGDVLWPYDSKPPSVMPKHVYRLPSFYNRRVSIESTSALTSLPK